MNKISLKGFLLLAILCFVYITGNAKRKVYSKSISGTYALLKQKEEGKWVYTNIPATKINIDARQHTIKCFVGCNSISGEFFHELNLIEPMELIATEMYCNDTKNAIERTFLQNMGKVNKYRFYKNLLYLLDDTVILLVLKRK